MKNEKLEKFALQIQQSNEGTLHGGFSVVDPIRKDSYIGGTETNNCTTSCMSNNCQAMNCVPGCRI